MAFQKKQWQFNDIITEGELNRMEDGIEEGITKAETVQAELNAHKNEVATQTEYGHIRLSDIPIPAGIPRGVIVMWSGSVDEIPEGWALCDGTNGTPDLRDRFIVGAGNEYDVGDTGGAKEVTLTTSQIPSHRHSSGTLSTSSGGDHSHSGSSASAGSHSHTGSTSVTSAHTHSYSDEIRTANLVIGSDTGDDKKYFGIVGSGTYNTGSGGSHSHTLTINSNGSHSHTITIDTAGSHSHSVTGYTDYTGSGQAHENRPPYYALAFIMKL